MGGWPIRQCQRKLRCSEHPAECTVEGRKLRIKTQIHLRSISKVKHNCKLNYFSIFQARTASGAKSVERECGNAFKLTAGKSNKLMCYDF